MNRRAALCWCVVVAACGGETRETESTSTPPSAKKATSGSAPSAAGTGAQTTAPTAAPSEMASASASAAAPAPPAFLATMFAGAPDAGVKMGQSRPFGRLTLGIPEGWMLNNSWDSVDHVTKKDSSAGVVILRLDLSEGLLDANIATWVKVPFSTSEVKWEPRESGKAGAAQLDAKVAKGAGKIGKDDAEFWQVATAVEKNKYGLVLVAGLKKSADDKTRAELMACVRSAAWK